MNTSRWIIRLYDILPRRLSSLAVRILKPTYPIGVVVVVFNDSGQLLVLEHTYHQPRWRLPGGLLERFEQPFTAAVREVEEEAACVITPQSVIDAHRLEHSFDIAIVARLVEEHPFTPNDEIVQRQWVEESDLQRLPQGQQIFVKSAKRFLDI